MEGERLGRSDEFRDSFRVVRNREYLNRIVWEVETDYGL
jgi:hypothetical protein